MKSGTKYDVHVINDKAVFNTGYRSGLLELLKQNNFDVKSFGFFESGPPALLSMMKIASNFSTPIISSNLRSNVVSLSLFWLRGLTIINGLGRHRTKKIARQFLLFLCGLNKKRNIVIQSYADYRYFSRYTKNTSLFWIPGSGGSKKKFGAANQLICVQRDDKIGLVSKSIKDLLAITDQKPLTVVGCKDKEHVTELFEGHDVKCPGYLPADDIFLYGGIFVQPSGYGEGFPHTLADAIVSQMDVYISGQEYIRYGLKKLGCKRQAIGQGWYKLMDTATACKHLSNTNINERYFDVFLGAMNGAKHENNKG